MSGRMWMFNPDRGGKKIPDFVKVRTEEGIQRYAEEHFAGRSTGLEIRFRGQFCYKDAYTEPDALDGGWPPADWPETREEYPERLRNTRTHLCRLRCFGNNRWGFAFLSCRFFPSGDFFGTPEEAFHVGAQVYLCGGRPTARPCRNPSGKTGPYA